MLNISHPDLCKEWDYSRNSYGPEGYKTSSGKKVWWRCSKVKHHYWDSTIANR